MADVDRLTFSIGSGVANVDAAAWDALHDGGNPFVSHRFLALLEQSGSVGPGTGWQSLPLLVHDDAGRLIAAAPAYAKGHSQGEYVFDHSWADAWQRAGGSYYPKLQLAVPFTPVPGPRLLGRDPDALSLLVQGAASLMRANDLSSAHVTFVEPTQLPIFERTGWLPRRDIQFHFINTGYQSFEDFLASLTAARRKQLRKERARAQADLRIENRSGSALTAADWDAMWDFYQDTGARKWGRPYLTRAAFALMAETMADDIIMSLAYDGGAPVAGAMHFVGRDTLYGRYWGARRDIPFLHFELCYYQAIDIAIAQGLSRVEAGAQGGHKLARGYAPVPTWSAHIMADASFHRAVADFLERERAAEAVEAEWLEQHLPFRKA
jgi:predicted N-acyltransferase